MTILLIDKNVVRYAFESNLEEIKMGYCGIRIIVLKKMNYPFGRRGRVHSGEK